MPRGLARGLAGAALFTGSTAVVLWQGTRVAALQDLSYVLNNAYRIAAGDVPYRDFTQPHAPLTFLIQAAVVRVFDSSYRHHLVYAALLSGLATLLAWAICGRLLRESVPRPELFAFAVCLPLIPLGIHSLFPHPWYDADASFLSLAAIYAMLRAAAPGASPAWPLAAGVLSVVPVFAKQNVGMALAAGLQLVALTPAFRAGTPGRHARFLAGSLGAAGASLLLIAATCGLRNYFHWTMSYAAERRLSLPLLLEGWRDARLWAWAGIAGAGLLLLTLRRRDAARAGLVLLLLPLVWGLLADDGTRVYFRLWPFTLLLAAGLALARLARGGQALGAALALAVIGLCQAAFLAHGPEGSSFALWPFFSILTAEVAVLLAASRVEDGPPAGESYLLLAALLALVTGVPRLVENRRLNYLHAGGPVQASRHPRLAGLHARGSYLPRLDELLGYLEASVPREEAIAQIHGEDPLYFALRRRPPLPLTILDTTVNPYTPEELVRLFLERDVRWVVVKNKRQIRHQPMARFERVVALLRTRYVPVLENETYLVLRREGARLARRLPRRYPAKQERRACRSATPGAA